MPIKTSISMGLIYFVHEWEPKFNAHALLDDPDMLKAVTAINKQIHDLAPVLNSPSVENNVKVESSVQEVPIDIMVKKSIGANAATYLFAVCMRDGETRGTFTTPPSSPRRRGERGGTEGQDTNRGGG